MKIQHIFPDYYHHYTSILLDGDLSLLRSQCSQFLRESSLPLIKTLPSTKAFYKLKARYRKQDPIAENINNALQIPLLLEKSVVVNNASDHLTKFYVFPINGYKFIYSDNIKESTQLFTMYNIINNTELYANIIQDLTHNHNINEAIQSNNQIMLYNIPYCYCVNSNAIESYKNLLKILRQE